MSPRTVTFHFENRRISAREGDSIAKALFEAGIRTLSYSVKYKRPRGIHCARGRCVMCHMEVNGVPGVATCITPVEQGMTVNRENFQPFFGPLLTAAARLVPFPAGFYYRMFTRPAVIRNLFLATLRRMAGVGRVHTSAGPRPRPATGAAVLRNHYDIVVVGAGLSGLSAATTAAQHGAMVLLIDEYGRPAGHSLGHYADEDRQRTRDTLIATALGHNAIDYCPLSTAQGFFPPNELLLGPGGAVSPPAENEVSASLRRVTASAYIFATGAYDIVPLFDNNDTPGIFGARALRLLLERDQLHPGSSAAVFGHGRDMEEVLHLLQCHDIDVVAVIDPGETPAGAFGSLPRYNRSRIASARGGGWVRGVDIEGERDKKRVSCDLVCTAFAGQGAYELPFQAGFRFDMSQDPLQENRVMRPTRLQVQSEEGVFFSLVGELAGQRAWKEKVEAGEAAGSRAMHTKRAS